MRSKHVNSKVRRRSVWAMRSSQTSDKERRKPVLRPLKRTDMKIKSLYSKMNNYKALNKTLLTFGIEHGIIQTLNGIPLGNVHTYENAPGHSHNTYIN